VRNPYSRCGLIDSITQDLSTIAFPVTFNEPLTLLQRAAEELEYYSILDEAAQSDDPVERLCYVAAFAVSGYAHTRHRSGRKGLSVHSSLPSKEAYLFTSFTAILC